jgi:hypothetical protein
MASLAARAKRIRATAKTREALMIRSSGLGVMIGDLLEMAGMRL